MVRPNVDRHYLSTNAGFCKAAADLVPGTTRHGERRCAPSLVRADDLSIVIPAERLARPCAPRESRDPCTPVLRVKRRGTSMETGIHGSRIDPLGASASRV